ncbi:MAG: GHKL domain-containing protein [Chitinophagaceae bacterium]|nr:MAG: GHKL domain-containing protein [Chitinophagaceae bacterium]
MDIYKQKYNFKLFLIFCAAGIVVLSIWYTNNLAGKIAYEERKKAELLASAYKQLNQADENTDISFLFEVIKNNESLSVILTDEDENIITWRNFDSTRVASNPDYLKDELKRMIESGDPIQIEISPGMYNYIYYKDSFILIQLRYFPYIQLGTIALFLLISYIAFSNTRKAEQNKVWVGMAKETAHQLGTPISSLMAWVEYLKSLPESDPNMYNEISKDVERLELISERFSKIGSKPAFKEVHLSSGIENMVQYFTNRTSEHVKIIFNKENAYEGNLKLMPTLFDWVLENLIKNAIDAMEGKGTIEISSGEEDNMVWIEIKDSGKGLPRSKFKTIFEPGFSTKKRGWGLGLSLSKRIVEEYHKGKIYVKSSILGEGTTFRIKLKKN